MQGLIKWALTGVVRASVAGLPRGQRLTRHAMYERLGAVMPELPADAAVLSVGHSLRLCHALGLEGRPIAEENYPDGDILALPYPDGTFDCVVSEAVLVHVEGDPRRAVEECRRVLKPGGVAVHATCFVYPPHYGPRDLWRFSPDALRLLHAGFSEVVEAGAWGNFFVLGCLWLGLQEERVPLARRHPVHRLARWNSEPWPLVTWIIARK